MLLTNEQHKEFSDLIEKQMSQIDEMMNDWQKLVGDCQFPPKMANEMIQLLFSCKNIMSPKTLDPPKPILLEGRKK